MPPKIRADQALYEQGLAESREQARRLIMAGRVFCLEAAAERPVDKAGRQFSPGAVFRIAAPEPYVSRGAYKLLTALEHFSIDVSGFVALDAGASSGGFTDCLLQHGAVRVYAADVGRNLLHERLKADPRVIVLEGVNLRYADAFLVPEDLDMVTLDLSFISLTLILGPCTTRLKNRGIAAALIKPQFEVGPKGTVRGIVRDPALREAAVEKILRFARAELNFDFLGLVPAAVKGNKGNQEYMALWRKKM
ncbi:MAG: TlyA family RNA methyltransferase [Desulfovibrio sp.]|jgi:23S rRNA (cytidine1920-2'-O)/16S rRNA (cytidine1409-2'-O)-methyltransferase|nr:TlyA family RNA methyltransferase [Desulfovibrio sp.]